MNWPEMEGSSQLNSGRKGCGIKYPRKRYALKVISVVLLSFAVIIGSGAVYINYAVSVATEFNSIPSEESPFPVLELNETLLHFVVRADYQIDGFAGAEERMARYHSVMGFRHSVLFYDGKSPDDINSSVLTAMCKAPKSLGDAAFLTGLSLFGQAYRWAVYDEENDTIGKKAAEHEIIRMLEGIYILTHITGRPGELVRFAFPLNMGYTIGYPVLPYFYRGKLCPSHSVYNPYEADTRSFHPAVNWSNWCYSDDTSRDQNLGVLIGLAAVYKFVKNKTIGGFAAELFIEITDYLVNSYWIINHEDSGTGMRFTRGAFFDTGLLNPGWGMLGILKVASVMYPEKYKPLFDYYFGVYARSLRLSLERYDLYYLTSYFPLNLAWLSVWMLVAFTDFDEPFYPILFDIVRKTVYKTVKNHRNAWFQCLFLSLMRPELRNNEKRVIAEIRDALQRMTRMRLKHFNNLWELPFAEIGINPNNSEEIASLYDPNTEKANSMLKIFSFLGEPITSILRFPEHYKYALPIDYRSMYDFPWQFNPFTPDKPVPTNRIEYFHTELTIVYWMAVYMGIVGHPSVHYTARIITQPIQASYWPDLNFPPKYYTVDSVIEAYFGFRII